ncbi:biotin--[acetyl-CoA-carboxylase] ligase [Candidatus Protochlamydia phocaeensis]|uniref:biotin--[acetyl-CoA-carboxylase] ligase n=1 Tax=Candidatus Protochlamydia phocaeensis TaxID=1414722 RepID=UPI000837CD3F|nr:biotin--[acetyl-CoA-carboxylase] ligase [Candidatus Protochlamydia phocaeensis]
MRSHLHYHFETIDSTNTWAKKNVDQLAPEGITLITASEQTGGRGRFKRRWESPPDVNIYATFCFFVEPNRPDIGHIPQLMALATVDVLEELEFAPSLKWPNDVLLQDKKVSGILCETVLAEQRRCIICGIGLNVNMPSTLLKKINRPATSLLVESQRSFEINPILKRLEESFGQHLARFLKEGFSPFFETFRAKSYFQLGQKVRFQDSQGPIEGLFETLETDGSVRLRLPNGISKAFYAGEFIS